MTRKTLAILFVTILAGVACYGQDEDTRIPAKFMFAMGSNGSSLGLLQPQAVRYDRRHQEYYLADMGHDRVVILNSQGRYSFDFRNAEVMRSPSDIAVDSLGRIYVLCYPLVGKGLLKFDYNGDYLGVFEFHGGPDTSSFNLSSMAVDAADRLFLVDNKGYRVLSYDFSGNFLSEFPIFKDLNTVSLNEQVLGNLAVSGDYLYMPVPMMGCVYCFDRMGNMSKTYGHEGGGYGELSFPIAAGLDQQGNVLVLDKHRHTIVRYNSLGIANGEFGGMGLGPGWFYHPLTLLVDPQNRVWVAQGYNNQVQVLQFPVLEEPALPVPENTVVVHE
jgi:DNA-binding beta-propeller fold protein YncE